MKNKTVVITGASSGIGYQTAIEFSKKNYNIVIGYNKSKETAINLVSDLRKENPNVIALKADLSIHEEANMLICKAVDQFGHIDVLVNNAGISQHKLFNDITVKDWQDMISINLSSCFFCTQAAVNDMIKRKQGKIINISSIWGIAGASCEVHYSASKAGIIGFTKALAKELGPSGIQVNCIAPGVINTTMNKHLNKSTINDLIEQTPLCRLGTAKDIANVILFLANNDSDFITGQVISPNGGFLI